MKSRTVLLMLIVFLTGSIWTTSTEIFAAEKALKSAGCKTEAFLLKDLAESYQESSGQKLKVGQTGNKKAVELLLEDKIDFAFTCKPIDILSKKLKLDQSVVGNWKSIPIAKDPIVIVANKKNGPRNITSSQLTEIFKGNIGNWKDVGGNDIPIKTTYMNPELESGVVLLFKEFTVGSKGELDKRAVLGNGPSTLGNYTSITPGCVTFMAFNSYQEKYGDILAVDGMQPTRENIMNGKYKLAATYYLTIDEGENEQVADFVDYVLSPNGQKSIERNFIPYTK
jgi:phosphate transport system substrate-binding protein